MRSLGGSTTAEQGRRSRRAVLASIAAAFVSALWTSVACADEVDVCISAAEQSQEQRRDAHLRAARARLVLCSRDACPRAIQKDCKRWLGEVEAAMPTIVIHPVDASGGDIVGARALVDGVRLEGAVDGRAVALDPGEHLLRVEAGASSVEQRIVIREGERDRLLPLRFPADIVPRPSPVPAGVWVLGGASAAAITAGALLWAVGRSEHGTLYATCGVTHDCAESAVDSARTKLVAGDIVFGAGLAAIGAAVWWGITTASAPRPPVAVQPVAGGGLVSWQGTF